MHSELRTLLQQRIDIIADHAFRDRDPAAHLEALKAVSEAITAYGNIHHDSLDARLRHYLKGCSYQKALEHLK